MNSILLAKNKYTSIGFGQTDKHSEQQYRLFINRVKLKQKNYVNALIMFVNIFNTFIIEKYPDEKNLWLIINNKQTTNYDILDSKDKIYNISEELDKIEERLAALENAAGLSAYKPQGIVGYIDGHVRLAGIVNANLSINYITPRFIQLDISKYMNLVRLPTKSAEFTLYTYTSHTLFTDKTKFTFSLMRIL